MRSNARSMTRVTWFLGTLCLLCGTCAPTAALDFPGPAPGKAVAESRNGFIWLENSVLHMAWQVSGGALRPVNLEDKIAGKTFSMETAECFLLVLARTPLPGTRTLRASELRVMGTPEVLAIKADEQATRLADRQPGQAITVRLASADGALEIAWQAVLRDGSN